MKADAARFVQMVERSSVFLAATFFVALGAINVAHNLLPLIQGAKGTWWPVVLGMLLFGFGPLLFGVWLILRSGGKSPPANTPSVESSAHAKSRS